LTAVAVSELPGPSVVWQIMAILLPMAVGVWLGLLILAPKYERVLPPGQAAQRKKLLLWAGVAGSGLLLAFAGMLGGGESIFPLGTTGLLIFLIGLLQRYRSARGNVTQIGEGPLLDRIRQLAAKAGTQVKAVKVIRSDSDTPAAFADRRGGILLSRALLRDLSRNEVDAIVAHELSHIRHNHAVQVRGWLMVLPIAIGVSLIVPGVAQWTALLLPTCFLTFMAVRRKQELTADADAARWTGEPEALIRGLARATRGTGVPFHWGRFVGLVIAHPPTSQRFQALGALAGVSHGRVEEIVTSVDAPAEPGYEVPGLTEADPVGNIAQTRAHLKLLLGWMSLLFPVLYSAVVAIAVRVETLGWIVLAAAELAGGIVLFYMLYEWIIARARSRLRDTMRKRLAEEGVESPGFFTGFSPAAWPALYEGMYDFEWGFVAFEGDRLILRGERGTFSAKREEVSRIWRDPGPKAWTAKPMLCFELVDQTEDRPRGFSVRPFDGAFGPMATSAGRKLLDAATAWHRDNTTGSRAEQGISLHDYPNPLGVPDLPYSWSRLMKGMMKLSGYVVAGVATLQFYVSQEWRAEPLLISVLVLWGLVIFLTWPAMRRSS
jgi:Zn-dependent protease with chaperone function